MIRQSLRVAACAAAILASCCFTNADDERPAKDSDNKPDIPAVDGQRPKAAHAEATSSGLQISLKVAQTTWKYDDKIDLVCTYRNVSSDPIRVPSWGTASEFVKSGFGGLEFVDANEKVLTCYMGTGFPFVDAPSAVPAFVEIPAGQSEHFIMTIQRDPTGRSLAVPGSAVSLSWNLPADHSELRVRAFVDTTRRQRLLWQQEVGEGVRKIWRGNLRTELIKIEVDTQPRNVAAIDVRLSTTNERKLIYKPGEPINIEVAKTNTSRRDQPIWHCGFWPNHELTVLYTDGTKVPLTDVGRQCARAFDPDAPRDKNVSIELKYRQVDTEGPFDLTKYLELQPGRAFVVRCRYRHESRSRQGANYLWSNDLLLRVEPTEKAAEQSDTERRASTDRDEQRPMELGSDKALIEIMPDDQRAPRLHAIGSIEEVDANLAKEVISLHEKDTKTRGNYGTKLARDIFLLHESGKIKPGCRALIGRIDGEVMFRNGFQCLSYSRKDQDIEIEVAHFTMLGGQPAAAYIYVPLPELPPGRYSVSMNFISAWRFQIDGEVRIVEQQRPSLCSSMACTFEVPARKAVATDPSQSKSSGRKKTE